MLRKNEKFKFMRRACLLCDRAACNYRVGALAVKKGKVILQAYNQTLPGEKYCQRGRCIRERRKYTGGQRIEIVCSLHAEASLVAQAASRSLSLKNATIYVSTFPCYICAKLLAKVGIRKLYFMSDYGKNEGRRFFQAAGVTVEKIPENQVWEAQS